MQGAGGVGGLLSESQITNSQISNYFPTYDGNGNISEYLSLVGEVIAHFEYDPFGNTVAATGTPELFAYRFSTKPLDFGTGLYYYGYRYYDPITGRWPSRDPIGDLAFLTFHSQGKSWREKARLQSESLQPSYVFVGNSPVGLTDILGLRNGPIGGQITVSNTCGKCPELLKNFRYIPEDNEENNFALNPIPGVGTFDADALYAPIGIAWKIGDPRAITIDCKCACKAVVLNLTVAFVKPWTFGEQQPSRWPGNNQPYVNSAPGFDYLYDDSGQLYP